MKKFESRMSGVLPQEELPVFFHALELMSRSPRKSIRIRRDLSSSDQARWSCEKISEVGIPLAGGVPWYSAGFFFDLQKMKPHPSRHPFIAAGIGFIQEAGAMEVVPAIGIEPDHLVLDLCAAPGAKSTHLGEFLGPEGWLIANEPDRMRAKLLDVILARHGIGNSTVYNLEPHVLSRECENVFDRILIDAPCSGESLFAKRTEKRKDISDKEVIRCALRQRAILEQAWKMLSPGGQLVYSTCAYSRSENEDVIAAFSAEHPDVLLHREVRRFPHRDGVPGGYFAVIQKEGIEESPRSKRRDKLEKAVSFFGTRGLVRDRLMRWDGSPDLYAALMNRKHILEKDRNNGEHWIELDLNQAERLLAGERSEAGLENGIYTWESERIAGIDQGRLIYPKGRLR